MKVSCRFPRCLLGHKVICCGIAVLAFLLLVIYVYKHQPNSSGSVYTNSNGGFSLVVPPGVNILETPEIVNPQTFEDKEYQFTTGEVYLSFRTIDRDNPNGLLIRYSKPFINGKGGACINSAGESADTKETIAGQEVSVCEVNGGFRASYFTNPKSSVEYVVAVVGINDPKEVSRLATMVRTSLKFD